MLNQLCISCLYYCKPGSEQSVSQAHAVQAGVEYWSPYAWNAVPHAIHMQFCSKSSTELQTLSIAADKTCNQLGFILIPCKATTVLLHPAEHDAVQNVVPHLTRCCSALKLLLTSVQQDSAKGHGPTLPLRGRELWQLLHDIPVRNATLSIGMQQAEAWQVPKHARCAGAPHSSKLTVKCLMNEP